MGTSLPAMNQNSHGPTCRCEGCPATCVRDVLQQDTAPGSRLASNIRRGAVAPMAVDGDGGEREGVKLTNLDQPLFDGADATKRDLVDYLDAMSALIVPALADRPLSVIRVRPG